MNIDKIRNIGLDKLVTQVYDFDSLTTDELMCKFAQKINIIIEHFNYLDKECQNNNENVKLKLEYLLGQGLEEKVANKLLELINDGTIEKLINQKLLGNINGQLDYIAYLKENDAGYVNSERIQTKLDSNTNVMIKSKNNAEYIIKNTIQINSNDSIILDNNTVLKNGSLSNMIRKKDNVERLQNVKLSGGIYNYNNQSSGGNNLHTIFIHKCDDLLIEKMQVLNSRKYAFLLADINRATIKDITLNTSSDGIHFQPPLKNVLVENIKGSSHDDMIAITIGDYDAYNTSSGNVEDIVIRNIQPNNSLTALKMCGQSGYKFKNVLMEQVYGTTTHEGFYLRSDGAVLNDFTADTITLRDINVKTGGDDYPLIKLWVDTQMNIDTLVLENIKHDGYLFDIRGTGNWTVNIKNLYLKNIDLSMSSSGSILKYFGFIGVHTTIENLYIDNVNINSDRIASTKYECFIENRGTIKNLYIYKSNVKYPVNKYSIIRNIDGVINNIFINELNIDGGASIYDQNKADYTSFIFLNNIISNCWECFNINANTTITINNFVSIRDGAIFRFGTSSNTYKINGTVINVSTPSRNIVAGASVGTILRNGANNATWS